MRSWKILVLLLILEQENILKVLDKNQTQDSNLIGQFGVGFYSAFIVSNTVTLLSRKAGDDKANGTKWTSKGKGEYSIETVDLERLWHYQ